ncbi:MAG: hypothetical protein R2856_36215 [Caldilineaceae bacterium]
MPTVAIRLQSGDHVGGQIAVAPATRTGSPTAPSVTETRATAAFLAEEARPVSFPLAAARHQHILVEAEVGIVGSFFLPQNRERLSW